MYISHSCATRFPPRVVFHTSRRACSPRSPPVATARRPLPPPPRRPPNSCCRPGIRRSGSPAPGERSTCGVHRWNWPPPTGASMSCTSRTTTARTRARSWWGRRSSVAISSPATRSCCIRIPSSRGSRGSMGNCTPTMRRSAPMKSRARTRDGRRHRRWRWTRWPDRSSRTRSTRMSSGTMSRPGIRAGAACSTSARAAPPRSPQ